MEYFKISQKSYSSYCISQLVSESFISLPSRLAAAENEDQQKLRQLADAEGRIRQLQHENELIEAKNNSLLMQQDNNVGFNHVSW